MTPGSDSEFLSPRGDDLGLPIFQMGLFPTWQVGLGLVTAALRQQNSSGSQVTAGEAGALPDAGLPEVAGSMCAHVPVFAPRVYKCAHLGVWQCPGVRGLLEVVRPKATRDLGEGREAVPGRRHHSSHAQQVTCGAIRL